MRPERFLGVDPTPGDLAAIDRLAAELREVVIALSSSRRHLEALVGPTSIWHGHDRRGLVEALSDMSRRLRDTEDAVIEFARALDEWRTGLVDRQERTASLTEWMSQLSGQPEADERRAALRAEAAQLAADHDTDAARLASAAEELSLAVTVGGDEPDLGADLDRGLFALTEAIEQWIAATARPLTSAVEAIDDAADVTAAVSVLVGFDGPISERAREVARLSTGAHRVGLALERPRNHPVPAGLAKASFDPPEVSVGARLRGAPAADDAAGDDAPDGGAR